MGGAINELIHLVHLRILLLHTWCTELTVKESSAMWTRTSRSSNKPGRTNMQTSTNLATTCALASTAKRWQYSSHRYSLEQFPEDRQLKSVETSRSVRFLLAEDARPFSFYGIAERCPPSFALGPGFILPWPRWPGPFMPMDLRRSRSERKQ